MKWEYEIKPINTEWKSAKGNLKPGTPEPIEIIEGYLQGMGEMGWELVGFLPEEPPERTYEPHWDGKPYILHAVFKRRVG